MLPPSHTKLHLWTSYTISLSTKFEISTFTHYKDMKVDEKCKKIKNSRFQILYAGSPCNVLALGLQTPLSGHGHGHVTSLIL